MAPKALPRCPLVLIAYTYPTPSLAFLPHHFVPFLQSLRSFSAQGHEAEVGVLFSFADGPCYMRLGAWHSGRWEEEAAAAWKEPDPSALVAGLGPGLLHSSGTGTSVLRTSGRSLFTSGKVQNCLSG